MTQEEDSVSSAEAKVFIISSIALSAAMGNAAFWYGVFGQIFFTYLFYIWIVATAALLATFYIPREALLPKLPWGGRFILALPTVWFLLDVLEVYRPNAPGAWALWIATLASAFLTLPYLLYVAIVAVVPDIDRLNTKLRLALLVIVLVMATASFVLGRNHFLFLTCDNFKVGDVPIAVEVGGQALPALSH
jgi:hypothetical protein